MDFTPLTALIRAEITFGSMLKFLCFLAVLFLTAGLVFRIFFGRKSPLNRAICAAIGILCIYIMTVVVYTFSPGNLQQYLVPLPFVKFSGMNLYIMPFGTTDFSLICSEILSMVTLVLVYNLTDSILPEGESPVTWFVLRFLTVLAAMTVHYLITSVSENFLPEFLVAYGPTVLLICLITSLLAGILGTILALVITIANRIFGLLFGFFFSNRFGKQISNAMLTTAVLSALVAVLGHFGYSIISIEASALLSYIPMLAALLLLWYVIWRKL